nr:uncharacterized protein CTRU02_08111 [Colletotrichum truncatum]KAF6790591.1 hypothetical protein CTRU02_08111 [Colletotrichum truncatum]
MILMTVTLSDLLPVQNTLILGILLFGPSSVIAGSCIAEPQQRFESRYDASFVKWAQQTCKNAGGNPSGGSDVLGQVCKFQGESPPSDLQKVWHPRLSSSGAANVEIRTKWTCKKG